MALRLEGAEIYNPNLLSKLQTHVATQVGFLQNQKPGHASLPALRY